MIEINRMIYINTTVIPKQDRTPSERLPHHIAMSCRENVDCESRDNPSELHYRNRQTRMKPIHTHFQYSRNNDHLSNELIELSLRD